MRYSKALIPTVKEVPADAEIPSHQLMIRAGLIRKLASGTYAYLPAGFRVLHKIQEIIRQEMNKTGAQETLMPSVHPLELWEKTGRDVDYGETMCKFKDRHGRMNVLAPTAEEVFTYIGGAEINSYKQLPINIYQMSFKFRDEFRPRFGVLRSREFIMKDAYSFHESPECLEKTYQDMYNAYKRVFERSGVEYVIVEAEAGEMGGSGSHQFTVPCQTGEDVIVYTEDSKYAANIEKAAVDAVSQEPKLENAPAMQEIHTPNVGSIEAVCEFLNTKPEQMIKSILYTCDEGPVMVLVRGDHEVNQEKLTQLLDAKHNELADEAVVAEVTNAEIGFAGPVGIEDKVYKLFIDHAVSAMAIGITGANKTDYHFKNVVPGRDFALEGDKTLVCDIRNAVEGDTLNGKKLLFRRGIEVGQVFKLGNKYSSKLNAKFLDVNGKEQICLMGCYGIGVNRIMASAIELYHDEYGIVWPISIAPFEVAIVPIGKEAENDAAEKLYQELSDAGIECLLDDRNARGGVKFNDADLLGVPVRITIGKKSLAEGKVELKLRDGSMSDMLDVETAGKYICELVNNMKAKLNS